MLDFKDNSGNIILTINDEGAVIVKDKKVAKDIEEHIIDDKELFIEETK